jgi:putative transposase
MAAIRNLTDRDIAIARVLRALGNKAMSMEQAQRAVQLLGMHWASVYRLRRRFLADPVASSVARRPRGPEPGDRKLSAEGQQIMEDTFSR